MSKKIKAMYKEAGIKAPDGKGIHKTAFHRCVISVSRKIKLGKMPKGSNPHSICMASIGRDKAVKKSHWR